MYLASRRKFLQHTGVATLFGSFAGLVAGDARSQSAPGRARNLLIFHSTGTNIQRWTPTGSTPTNLVFSEMTETLAPLRSELVILENLDSMGSASQHGQTGGLSGRGYVAEHLTLDQLVADGLRAQGVSTDISVLLLGGNPREAPSTFKKGNRALTPIFEPEAAFDIIFGGAAAGTDDSASVAERIRRQQSILDLTRAEVRALASALDAEGRQRLELHEQSIRTLEQRLETRLADLSRPPEEQTCAPPSGLMQEMPGIEKTALSLDMAVTALGCGVTRVAAVEFGHHQSFQVDMDAPSLRGDWHNGFLHGEGGNRQLIDLELWLGTQFVEAAEKLKRLPAPDGNGTLFDQTLMVWTRGMGDGLAHSGSDMRFVISGGAGGYVKTAPNGRYIRANGEPHQRVLTACAEALGVTDFTNFGDDSHDKSPFSAISS
ncbi:MAG: DUF1552 domain-containing protein [Myxococcota bacterium]